MNQDDEEKWKDIEGYEGIYMVSDKGRVMNLKSGRVLKPAVDGHGYEFISLCKNGKVKQCTVHRLVADAFISNTDNLPQVNHINENKRDNNMANLEWCSASHNTKHSIHKRSCKISQYSLDGEYIRQWNSSMDIKRELGFNQGSIIQCCKGKLQQAYGYRWEYVDGLHQQKHNRPIVVLSKEDDFVAQFKNTQEASRCLGIIPRSIYYALNGITKTTHGFKFKYADEI